MLVFDGNPSLYRLAGTCPAVVFYFYFPPSAYSFWFALQLGGTQYKLKLYPSPRLVPIWIDMLELSCWMRLASSENWVLLKIRPKKPESIHSKSLCRLGIVRVCRSRSRNSVSLSLFVLCSCRDAKNRYHTPLTWNKINPLLSLSLPPKKKNVHLW